MSILEEIVIRKYIEVAARRDEVSPERMEARALAAPAPRDFLAALQSRPGGPRVIAEFKRASPSRGPIRAGADAAEIARAYAAAGAAALSVLTDRAYFGGTLEDLSRAREASGLPVLRKDFIIDPYQIHEARGAGADAVLLIARCLNDWQILDLETIARSLGMAALVEVHDRGEMERVARIGCRLIGINNRDLATLEISLETTRRLLPLRPPGALIVSESGFSRREEMDEMTRWGVDAFLIGESLMRAPDPGAALRAMVG